MFRLLKLNKNINRQLVLMVALSVVYAALTLAAPMMLGSIIDSVADNFSDGYNEALKILIILAMTYLLAAAFSWFISLHSTRLSQDAATGVRSEIFKKFNHVPIKELDTRPSGDLLARAVNDTEILAEGLMQGASHLVTDIILIAGTIGILIYINIILACVVIGLTPLSVIAATLIARYGQKYFNKQADEGGKMTAHLSEYLTGIKTVKAFGTVKKAEQMFEGINDDFTKVGTAAVFCSTLVNPSARLVSNLIFAGVAAVGAVMCISGGITVGLLTAALSYVYQYGKPFNELSSIATELQKAASASKRINEILSLEDEVETSLCTEGRALGDKAEQNACDKQKFLGNIEFKDVCFSYDEKPFIEGFNLKVSAGEKVAIVGPTGGGKTTLINLLMRFYDITGGSITIDGVDIRDVTRKMLRKNIGMVLQESWLFEGTVAENIAFGKIGATREEIIAAAQNANAAEFIEKLEKNYDTMIFDHSFSEGQRQQIALARVLLSGAPMLIFDEATSNLDTQTEQNIVNAIAEISIGKTSFIVAHRLVTVKSADLVIVIADGKIIESGTHDELLNAHGFYEKLYQKQLSAEEQIYD